MKLGLGTVEFAAKRGKHAHQVSLDEAREILALAAEQGIDLLDTAGQAGNSEKVLGEILPNQHGFRIVARAPGFGSGDISPLHADQLELELQTSLENLRQETVDALMLGAEEGLFCEHGERLFNRAIRLRERGLIRRIGVSVADGGQLNRLLENFQPDIVQLPLNVLDQRMLQHLPRLHGKGIEIHARDIFLQGVLLDPTRLHPWFWPIKKLLNAYHEFLVAQGLTPLEGALAFIGGVREVNYALVGVQTAGQLREIIQAMSDDSAPADFAPFACPDPRFTDPRLWNLYE